MIFEQVATGGSRSYLMGCGPTCAAALVSFMSLEELPDPTLRILTLREFGRVSTLAAATLRQIGFQRAIALDGGMKAWRAAGYPLLAG
jgi:rhodanese-related sulfurtransferase